AEPAGVAGAQLATGIPQAALTDQPARQRRAVDFRRAGAVRGADRLDDGVQSAAAHPRAARARVRLGVADASHVPLIQSERILAAGLTEARKRGPPQLRLRLGSSVGVAPGAHQL